MFTAGGAATVVDVVVGAATVVDADVVVAACCGELLPHAPSARSATQRRLADFADCGVNDARTDRGSRRVEDFDDEPERLVRGDGRRPSLAAVRLVGGDAEEALPAHLHAGQPVLPSLDDVGERERRRLAP